ncbi:hypothetical protein [Corynebacterium rouxii]|uniref:Uncharacterized protein n=1 Tax=Corynebacterium rouxii TaxID=2719119 RepID=A0A6I8M7Z2_9CORY|nr:hypothetical protein FRC0190_00018 [Corynebacterium rouxii]
MTTLGLSEAQPGPVSTHAELADASVIACGILFLAAAASLVTIIMASHESAVRIWQHPDPQLSRVLSECESVRSSTSFAAINDSISDTVGISSHPAATTTRPATIAPPHSATEPKKSSDQGH